MQPHRPNSYTVPEVTFRVGDRVCYYVYKKTPEGGHVHINEGVISKIEDDQATVKLPDGKVESVFIRKLGLAGETHVLSRALSRRGRGRRMQ